jgi:hypothetical protein
MGLQNNEPLIHAGNVQRFYRPVVNGERKGHGYIPRDYSVQPLSMFDPPTGMKLIPRSEWKDRIKEQKAKKTRNSDILRANKIKSLDQDGAPYCWGHSVTGAMQGTRAVMGLPFVELSAFMVCAFIKHGQQEGGWCGLSAEFIRDKGICSVEMYPRLAYNYRSYDKPEVWADAAKHKIEENWTDLTREVYDQNLTFDQLCTCHLNNEFTANDWNDWSHSTMGCDVEDLSDADIRDEDSGKLITGPALMAILGPSDGFGTRGRNSWSDDWGDEGFFVRTGSKAIPDGAIAIRTATAA